jgi:photosystem II stability/assembly factor-like uncharacterized protein
MSRLSLLSLCLFFHAAMGYAAGAWVPVGPPGGDVRALAADPRDPRVIYLGTADGVLYRSDDAGARWARLQPGFPLRGQSLDDIVIDPRGTIFVGYWEVSGAGGGVARSDDGGHNFKILPDVSDQPVRALAIAASDPRVLVAGTPSGLFRSTNAGASWERISPRDHPELRNLDSVAIDPLDPGTIYAGTWHLPWKTGDGGRHWAPISAGMIEDSDVMTMTLDRRTPRTVFATACSGIYRSNDAAARWAKLGGIPSSSRRTRAFAQSVDDPRVFYAGTTEGLFVSRDDTASWHLVTAKTLVLNAVLALPGGTLLLGADGAGVLKSSDGGTSFTASNAGFSERFVSSIAFDAEHGRTLVGVRGDRTYGGAFEAPSGAAGPWAWRGAGLEGREVLSLLGVGTDVLAGTDDGLFVMRGAATAWQRLPTEIAQLDVHPRIEAIAVLAGRILAASPQGLLRSSDGGRSWSRLTFGLTGVVTGLATRAPELVIVATPLGVYESRDAGGSFRQVSPALETAEIRSLVLGPGDVLFALGSRGLLRSTDLGRNFSFCEGGLPRGDIEGLAFHPDGHTVFASDFARGGIYASADMGVTWRALPNDGLVSARVWALAVEPRTSRLLASAATGGVHAFQVAAP